jgi:hypothetical protein
MKRLAFSLTSLFIFAISAFSVFAEEISVEQIVEKIKKAADPNGVREKLKTMIVEGKMNMPSQKIVGEFVFIDKFPNKSKAVSQIPGLMLSVQAYNGKVAWESTNAMGIRTISGRELKFLEFTELLKDPKGNLTDIFSKIDLDKNGGDVDGKACYKLVCYPPKEYELKPFVMYVDKNSFYMLKVEMTAVTKLGDIPTVAVMSDFKDVKGLVEPMKTVMTQLTETIVMEVKSIELDKEVDDSIFEIPKE